MATYAQFKHVELYKIGHGKNRVPNAPKSSIGEIFGADHIDAGSPKNGVSRPRVVRDTPTRPRDTHSRLFGQNASSPPAPMLTNNIRSHIQFGEGMTNGVSTPAHSPSKPLTNGSASSTPSRGETESAEYSSHNLPRRNPVTGDGVQEPPMRRRHPAAKLRGADPDYADYQTLPEPRPTHAYYTQTWPPNPGDYYVQSTTKPPLCFQHTPYSLIGLYPKKSHDIPPEIDPDSLSPQSILNRHWPPFPGQHMSEKTNQRIPYHPLSPHSFIGMTSALGERPKPDYKYNPIPSLNGGIDPYLVSNLHPPPTLMKYEYDGPIPDVTLYETPVTRGPNTLTGFPPIFHKHVPGYLFNINRHVEDFKPKTYFVDYIRRRDM